MKIPCGHDYVTEGCHFCHLVSTKEKYRLLWGSNNEAFFHVKEASDRGKPEFRICIHEGLVVEWAPCNCEGKHVRFCNHPDSDMDRCTRDTLPGSPYQDCSSCSLKSTPE